MNSTFNNVAWRVAGHVKFSDMALTKEDVEEFLNIIDMGTYLEGDNLVAYPLRVEMPYSDFEHLVTRFLDFKRPFL